MEYNVDHWRKTRAFIKASNLVRELFKQGFFKPITFGKYHILNTDFYNEVDADIKNINLKYDKKYCTKLIAPAKVKTSIGKKTKADPTYLYANFETDVSGKYHKVFICVLQSRNGQINKSSVVKIVPKIY